MSSTPTASFDFQNFYSETLSSDITAGTLTIPLSAAPTPSEGILVIDPDSTTPEIIYYTSKGASSVTCPADGRGWDSTTAASHLQGTTVIMAPVGYMFRMMKNGSLYDSYRTGWTNLGYAPATVTCNGNRSYDLVFSGVDLTGTVMPGTRLEMTRTVAAPTYMGGAFNGSNQYFTKTTPSGTLGTVTNNFTIMGFVELTAYGSVQTVCGRADSTPANGIQMRIEATGQIGLLIWSGGAANYRIISTYQSLPLNKKVHVAATWASGTVVIYFDGVSVPVGAASTGGTAPTTAGTGGDWSIGRAGAYNSQYFTGYISNVAVFDAVLSAATIKSYISQSLSGAETNCIGYWSLNNVATDSSASANTLTAQNSVSYTARTPYTQTMTGITAGTLNYGIVQKASFSTNTTLTVQIPEGETLPTSGGITSVKYSSQKAPYGFPTQRGKWRVESLNIGTATKSSAANGTWYNGDGSVSGEFSLSVPVGEWLAGYEGHLYGNRATAGVVSMYCCLSTTNAAIGEIDFISRNFHNDVIDAMTTVKREKPISTSAITTYYLNHMTDNSSMAASGIYTSASQGGSRIYAENAFL